MALASTTLLASTSIASASKLLAASLFPAFVIQAFEPHRRPVSLSRLVIRKQATQRASTTLARIQERWFRLPEPLRFFISGNFGNICLFTCDSVLGIYLRNTGWSIPPAVAFFFAYMMHIPAQHLLHASLVYGICSINTKFKYITTLLETYSALGASAVGSAALNGFLRHRVIPNHRLVAFCLTMAIFAVVNYTLMHYIMASHGTNVVENDEKKSTVTSNGRRK